MADPDGRRRIRYRTTIIGTARPATTSGFAQVPDGVDAVGPGVARWTPRRGRGGGDRMTLWRNWAGNQRTSPAGSVVARSTGDVVDAETSAARDGLRVEATGSGHSFTGIGVPDGIALAAPAGGIRVDGMLATVPAGTTVRALNAELWDRGLALPNLRDIDAQTIAGAVATGTHGTGARHTGIAARVRGLELVLADGTVPACSATENLEVFHHARPAYSATPTSTGSWESGGWAGDTAPR